MAEHLDIRKVDIAPVDCIRQGWEVVKGQYWLFVGITAVAILIGSAVPLGILMGPMLAGVYICILAAMRGEKVEFSRMFRGFDFFLPSFIVSLILAGFGMILGFGSMLVMFIMMALGGAAGDTGAAIGVFGGMAVMFILIMGFSLLAGLLVMFSFQLIVDKKLGAMDALKYSLLAVKANLLQVLGLMLLTWLLGMLGVLCCYVGAFLVMPVTFAATTVAYRKIFPETV